MSRTAVIVVHGVGSPPRNDTARAVADLLVGSVRDAGGHAPYRQFEEHCLTIPTEPVRGTGGGAEQKMGFAIGARDRTTFVHHPPDLPPDVAFMTGQLAGYQSAHEPYDTVELVGTRSPAGEPASHVHVFEMYWADLSRLGTGFGRVFGAVFQLIQHVSHLGRKALDVAREVAASKSAEEQRAWRWYAEVHARAVRQFTIWVPVSTLLMLAFLPLFIPAAVAPGWRLTVGLLAAGLLLLVAAGMGFFELARSPRAASWFVAFMLVLVAAGIAMHRMLPGDHPLGTILLAGALAAATSGAFLSILHGYAQTRAGAFGRGVLLLLLVLDATTMSALRHMPHAIDLAERIRQFAFMGVQWGFLALMLSWMVLWLMAIASYTVWGLMVRPAARAAGGNEFSRARRAAWTASVTLTLSAFSFTFLALVSYGAIVHLAEKGRGVADIFPQVAQGAAPPRVTSFVVPDSFQCPATVPYDGGACSVHFFREMIAEGGTSGLLMILMGGALALLLVSWFVALIAVSSVRTLEPEDSVPLGNWMTSGFFWLRVSGVAFTMLSVGGLLVGAVADVMRGAGHQLGGLSGYFDVDTTKDILDRLAIVLLASATTLAAAKARLNALSSKARPAVGIVLDVDNYLRESPYAATPRARIAERYTSLLRHVAGRVEEGKPCFDRIVIVAHSQGTVITADLLRFMRVAGRDARLIDGRFSLVTMGCPLRQLYATNFPHLYGWVDASANGSAVADDDATATATLGAPAGAAPADAGDLSSPSPSPLWLGVTEWVNLFTTGDYVGRTLWRGENPRTWERQTIGAPSTGPRRRERCLGAGTHTRYWTSGDVAEELDRLIGAPLAGPPPGAGAGAGAATKAGN